MYILIYIVLLFTLSWSPWFISGEPALLTLTPSLLAVVFTIIKEGKRGLKSLFIGGFSLKKSWKLYVLAIVGPGAIVGLGLLIHYLVGGFIPSFNVLHNEKALLPVFFLIMFLPFNGPIGEELGWRGFLLPKLQERFGAFLASLFVGMLWGIWHLPDFFIPGRVQYDLGLALIGVFVLGTIGNSIIMTYLYNSGRSSVLLGGVLWHGCFNFWSPILLTDFSIRAGSNGEVRVDSSLYILVVISILLGALIVTILSKGRLGYKK